MSIPIEILMAGKDMLGQSSVINRQTFGINYFGFNPSSQTVSSRHEPFGDYYNATSSFYQTKDDFYQPYNPSSFNPDKEPRWDVHTFDLDQEPFTSSEIADYKKLINPYASKQIEMGDRYKNKLNGFGTSS